MAFSMTEELRDRGLEMNEDEAQALTVLLDAVDAAEKVIDDALLHELETIGRL